MNIVAALRTTRAGAVEMPPRAGGGLNFEERKSEKMKRKPNSS
jgi:hypothetical protein